MQPQKDATVLSLPTPSADSDVVPCWSCKGPVDCGAFFCPICDAVQPPGQTDHFSRLGLSRTFDVDGETLDRCYFDLQRRLHPDRFATKTPCERMLSQQQATSLNEAYETLKDPLRRAAYLVGLKGGTVLGHEDSLANDRELLMETMERRESLSEAETAEQVDAIVAVTADDIETCVARMSGAFSGGDLEAACRLTTRLKYLRKLAEEARIQKAKLGRA